MVSLIMVESRRTRWYSDRTRGERVKCIVNEREEKWRKREKRDRTRYICICIYIYYTVQR